MHRYTHKHTLSGRKDAHECTNTHNRKSVNEWEGAGRLAGAVLVEDRASVHLSISKHSQLSSLSTGGEVIPFFFSPLHLRPLSSPHFCFPPCSSLFSCLIYLLSTSPFIYFPHSLLSLIFFPAFSCFSLFSTTPFSSPFPSFLLCCSSSPALSVEQPIQQQNKAAYSITHWLIKQDQNSDSLRSTQQHHDTGLHWRVEVSQIRRGGSRGKENVELEKTVENKYAQDNISC